LIYAQQRYGQNFGGMSFLTHDVFVLGSIAEGTSAIATDVSVGWSVRLSVRPSIGCICHAHALAWLNGPPQSCTQIIMPASRLITWKSFVTLGTLAPKL